MEEWSNIAKVTYCGRYSRKQEDGTNELWTDTIIRAITANLRPSGNVSKLHLLPYEGEQLEKLMLGRKASPAGRGLWYNGSASHNKLGGAALNNCWFLELSTLEAFVMAQDYLMLGGGVGVSVEHRFISKLPDIKPNVTITHVDTADADFIVPDTREGWNELTRRVLDSFLYTGCSFSYSTCVVRGAGNPIRGFGGVSSGPLPLIHCINSLCSIISPRSSSHLRPLDCADIICTIADMVVAGNVRRSAIIILGDSWDGEYLRAKRFDLGSVPSYRARANFSVVCSNIEDLHTSFWKTYEVGEPFGIINRRTIRKYGRMGELHPDTAMGVNPCKPLYSTILTDKGYITFKQALTQEALMVWTPTGFRSATKPFKTGEQKKVYRITLSNGTHLYGTSDHKHMTKVGEWKTLGEFVIGERLQFYNTPIYDLAVGNKSRFEAGTISGWVYGDGWFSNRTDHKGYNIGMCFGVNELDVVSYFENLLETTTKPHEQKPDTCRYFRSHKKELVEKVLSEGMSLDKNDLTWLYGKDEDFKLGFIKAVFTADGSVRKNNNVELYSVRRNALEVISNILREFGVYNTICVHNNAKKYVASDGKIRNNSTCYKINVYAGQFKKIKFLSKYKNDLLSLQVEKPIYRYVDYVSVVNIEPEFSVEDVYDITVDSPEHLFLDVGVVTSNCAEATLEHGEPCNLQEIFLPNLDGQEEFNLASRLMHRWGKRVTMERYHNAVTSRVVERNRRVGTGVTGCLQSSLFTSSNLDEAYLGIQKENSSYSKLLGVPESIRTTVIKPSGTLSLIGETTSGIHCGYSLYYIRRIRFASNDPIVAILRANGHPVETEVNYDGTPKYDTQVVTFYERVPEGTPTVEGWSLVDQLNTVLHAQKHWADQSVSCTVYYDKDRDIPSIKEWLSYNLGSIKSISFLAKDETSLGSQMPLEAISEEVYEKGNERLRPFDVEEWRQKSKGTEYEILDGSLECEGEICPAR